MKRAFLVPLERVKSLVRITLINRIYEVDTLKCLKSAKLIVFYLKTREEEQCRLTVTFARVDISKHNMHTNIPIPFLYMGHYPRNCKKGRVKRIT